MSFQMSKGKMHDFHFPSDETYELMIRSLKLTKFESDPEIPSYFKARIHKNCTIGMRNGRKVILDKETMKPIFTQNEMPAILKRFHDDMNHPGRDITRKRILEEFAFCNLLAVSNYINNCNGCLTKKHRPKFFHNRPALPHAPRPPPPPTPPRIPNLSPNDVPLSVKHSESSVMHQVDVDIIDMSTIPDPSGLKNKWLIQMVDHASQFVWAQALAELRSKNVAMFIQSVFLQFGEPRVLHTENGSEFTEEPFKEMLRRFPNVEHVLSHPRTTKGTAEKLLKKRIREWTRERTGRRTWESELPFIVSDVNKCASRVEGKVPFDEMFLRPYAASSSVSDAESEDEEESSKRDEEEEEAEEEEEKKGSEDGEEEEELNDNEGERDSEDEKGTDDEDDEDETDEDDSDLPTVLSRFLEEQETVKGEDHLPVPSNRSPVLLFLQKPLKAVAVGYLCAEINEVRGNRATKQFQFYKLVKVIERVCNPNEVNGGELQTGSLILWDDSNVIKDVGTTVRDIEAKIPAFMSRLEMGQGQNENEVCRSQKRESTSAELESLAKKVKIPFNGKLKDSFKLES